MQCVAFYFTNSDFVFSPIALDGRVVLWKLAGLNVQMAKLRL